MRAETMAKEEENSSMIIPSDQKLEVSNRFHLQTFQKHLLRKLDKIGMNDIHEQQRKSFVSKIEDLEEMIEHEKSMSRA